MRLLLIAVLAGCGSAGGAGGNTAADAEDHSWETLEVTDNVYSFRYDRHYAMFVVTSEGLVVFDPLSNPAAEQLVPAMREVAPDAPLRALFYSHWHADHSSGGNVLKREYGDDFPIYAHERAATRLADYASPRIPLPTETFGDDGAEYTFGDTTIRTHYLGHAHTNTMAVFTLPEQRAALAVDFVNNDGAGYTDLPGVEIDELFAMFDRLLELDYDHIAFGHTPPGDKDSVRRQIAYFTDIREHVVAALAAEQSEDDATTSFDVAPYGTWARPDWIPENVRALYRWYRRHPWEEPPAEEPPADTPVEGEDGEPADGEPAPTE